MKTLRWRSKTDAEAWVRLQKDLWRQPLIVLLSGPMGAGKTQLVRWILAELGCENTASPSFAIHHRYEAGSRPVDHFDLFRLKADDELESSGFWDVLAEKDNLVFIEWADRLEKEVLPKGRRRLWIELKLDAEGSDARAVGWALEEPVAR